MNAISKIKDLTNTIKAKLNIRRVVRRLRIRFGWWNLSEKMTINGVVECQCGGQIISNSGKTMMNGMGYIRCWNCLKVYDGHEVYYERKKGQRVVFK